MGESAWVVDAGRELPFRARVQLARASRPLPPAQAQKRSLRPIRALPLTPLLPVRLLQVPVAVPLRQGFPLSERQSPELRRQEAWIRRVPRRAERRAHR